MQLSNKMNINLRMDNSISSSTINALKGFAVSIAHSKRPLSNILAIKSDNNIEQKYHFERSFLHMHFHLKLLI